MYLLYYHVVQSQAATLKPSTVVSIRNLSTVEVDRQVLGLEGQPVESANELSVQ